MRIFVHHLHVPTCTLHQVYVKSYFVLVTYHVKGYVKKACITKIFVVIRSLHDSVDKGIPITVVSTVANGYILLEMSE